MNAPLFILRPEPGLGQSLDAARAMGLEAWGFQLFEIAPRAWQAPPADSFDALLIGSANAIHQAGPQLRAYAGKRAYCVGAATAAAARHAGLDVAGVGTGGLQAVLDTIPAPAHLLRLAGEAHVPLGPAPGIAITTRILYASQPLVLPDGLARLLATAALGRVVVALHSAEAARHFAAECDRLGLARGHIACVVIGPRVGLALGEGWAEVATAPRPDDASLLALAAQLCQA